MSRHRTFAARAIGTLAATVAIAAAALAVATPPPASAADGPACQHDRSYNACLTLDWWAGPPWYYWLDAHVGIDVYMPEHLARDVIACGPDFRASLWGDDGRRGPDSSDDHIRDLDVVPGWPIADSTGIAADLIGPGLRSSDLDEDDRDDQIYARVSFYDCTQGRDRNFNTGYIVTWF